MNSGVIGNQFINQQQMAVLGQGTYYQQVDYISLCLGKDGSESNATKSKLEDIRVLDKNHGRSDQV